MFTTASTISPGSRRKELLNSSGAAFPVHPGGKQAGAGLGFQPGGWSHCAPPRLPSGSSNRSLISQELPNPARITCCFQSRKELGVSSVLCKIRRGWGGARGSPGESSGPGGKPAEPGTRLRAGLQRGGGRSRRMRRAESRGAETGGEGGAAGLRRPNRRGLPFPAWERPP